MRIETMEPKREPRTNGATHELLLDIMGTDSWPAAKLPHWPTLEARGWQRVPTAMTGGKPWFFTKQIVTGERVSLAWDRQTETWRFTIQT